jgi:hypothetical protein
LLLLAIAAQKIPPSSIGSAVLHEELAIIQPCSDAEIYTLPLTCSLDKADFACYLCHLHRRNLVAISTRCRTKRLSLENLS